MFHTRCNRILHMTLGLSRGGGVRMVLPANAQSPRFADSGRQHDASSGSARIALIDASPRPERAPPAASGEYRDARHHPPAPQQEALPARPGDSTGYVLV